MDEHETTAKYNLAETCCASISIEKLLSMSSMPLDALSLLDTKSPQFYGEIRGSKALRGNLAGLYSAKSPGMTAENILITPGAISANFLVFYALLGPGDHVICQYPTYQQLYSVPASVGAEVSLWKPKHLDGRSWEWDVDQLKGLIRPNTKMVILNNPNNPTGAILTRATILKIVEIAREARPDMIIHSDEVYRPIFHSISPMSDDFPPSMISVPYEHTIVSGSMSKAYSLAGLRVGWVASRSAALVERIAAVRHYTTISVGLLDQQVAALATSQMCLHGLLGRNIALAKTNLEVLDAFVREATPACEWVKPVAGTTALVRFKREGKSVDDVEFCERLQADTGVMFLPAGRGFGEEFRGHVRIGYVCETEVLKAGLEQLRGFLKSGFAEIALVG